MKVPGWRREPSEASPSGRPSALRANDVSSRSVAFAPVITPAMVARSGSVADPRWSPTGSRLAWIVAHDGRADLVVAPADASGPPVIVTADTGIGGGYAWIDDDELVVAAGDGRAVVIGADGRMIRALTRDGRALAPAVSAAR